MTAGAWQAPHTVVAQRLAGAAAIPDGVSWCFLLPYSVLPDELRVWPTFVITFPEQVGHHYPRESLIVHKQDVYIAGQLCC